jgi:nucleotide-binding universal stress UspA family protein
MAVDPPQAPYQRILAAVDGSETAAAGLLEAIRIARLTRGSLHLVHVVDVLEHVNGFETCATYTGEVLPHLRRAGQAVLDAALACATAHGVAADSRLVEVRGRRTADVILEAAEAVRADLIVLGTHGRRGMDRAFAGSDAEQILRRAPVPVLLVRLPAAHVQAADPSPAPPGHRAGAAA